jgi:hypothetical protein
MPAHVLRWVPAFLCGDSRGYWALQDTDAYDAHRSTLGCLEVDEPVDATRDVLTARVTAQTGSPVVLEDGGYLTLTAPAGILLLLDRGRAPIWYVWPVLQP